MIYSIEYSTMIKITYAVYHFYIPKNGLFQDDSSTYKDLQIESIPVEYCYHEYYIKPIH